MRRTLGVPLAIALLAGGLTWLIQAVLRPATVAQPMLQWLLGPAPNVVVGLCFPFLGLAYPLESLAHVRRAIVAATLITVAILVGFELWRPIAGARTYDPLDIAGSVGGGLAGGVLAHATARRLGRTRAREQPPPDERRSR